MILDTAVHFTALLLGLAFLQQSIEHIHSARSERQLFLPRVILSIFLIVGFQVQWACVALVILALFILKRFQGPYNGGSDRMSLLILCCLCLTFFMPTLLSREVVFGYLALQVVLSYFIAGWVKILNPAWRNGRALQDVFLFSAYPVSEATRAWANRPQMLFLMSWGVMLFELLFPLSLLTQTTLIIGLAIATCFHLANFYLFGLNRFFWIWLAAYPSLLWLQHRIFL